MEKNGYYDLHNHLLYGMDDGCTALDETVDALRIAYGEGIRHMVFTPHYRAMDGADDSRRWGERMTAVRRAAAQEGMGDFVFYEGREVLYTEGIPALLKEGKIKTIAATHYVLVEFLPYTCFQELFQGLNNIIQAGYQPILAHVERYSCLYKKYLKIEYIRRTGTLLQMNADLLMRGMLDGRWRWYQRLVINGDIQLIATDSHGPIDRPPKMEKAVCWLRRHCTDLAAQKILMENPQAVLDDKYI